MLNAAPIEVNYYLGQRELPLSILIFLLLLGGYLFGMLSCLFSLMCLRWQNHSLKNRLARLESQGKAD